MTAAVETPEIGKVLSAAFGNLAANAPTMIGIVAGAGVLGGVVDSFAGAAGNSVGNFILFFVVMFSTLKALKTRCGEDADIQPHGGRVFGINILSGLAMLLGFALFVFPGIMLFTRWAVAVPAMMREDLGVMDSLGRSRDLTDGSRWRILGLALIVWVPFLLVIVLVGGLAGAFGGEAAANSLPMNIVTNILASFVTTFSSILWVETYLVLSGGGAQQEQLAEIFA